MEATLRLDVENERMEFSSPDFFLRFSIPPAFKSINRVIEVGSDFVSFEIDGEEEIVYLSDSLMFIGLDWDFSKYKLEVLI